jgi:cobalt-precorrin 5A hydrolase
MRVGIAAFTQRGKELATRLIQKNEAHWEVIRYEKDLKQWCARCFEETDALIFIGACGIAVRTIAPFVKSKTTDPAVLVLDEAGQFVISLLSGHIGGANELALQISGQIGAVPVITTASDVNGKLAVDVFAKKNHLQIASMTDAKKLEAALLRGETIGVHCSGVIEGTLPPELKLWDFPSEERTEDRSSDGTDSEDRLACQKEQERSNTIDHLIWISEYEPDRSQLTPFLSTPSATILHLIPQSMVLGIGCRKGKPEEDIEAVVEKLLEELRVSPKAIHQVASIDLKKDEAGIRGLCQKYGWEFVTYPASELEQVPGDFTTSEFVRKTTGVDNVCERSARLAAGDGAEIIRKKYAENGVTAALAVRKWRVRFEE